MFKWRWVGFFGILERMEVFFVLAFGLAIGSFLNAVVYRMEAGGSIVTQRSRCPKCGHILSWYELFPVLSFAVQLGKCRACKQKIAWQYPLVELALAALFLWLYLLVPQAGSAYIAYLFFVSASLAVIFIFDLKHYIIPNKVLYPLTAVVALFDVAAYGFSKELAYHALAACAVSGFFLLQYLGSKGTWIGFGDVKFAVFMGLFLAPWSVLVALFSSYFIGAFVGSVVLLLGKKGLQSEIPFGPFLVAGTFIGFAYGENLINWYLHFNILLF
jgi:prepilin signal peptidase PulO-like enzyme (type II secretory pathway)